jgi:hypothetical protein
MSYGTAAEDVFRLQETLQVRVVIATNFESSENGKYFSDEFCFADNNFS